MNPNITTQSPSIEEISVNLDKLAAIQSQKKQNKFKSPISLSTILITVSLVSLVMVVIMGGMLLSNATTARYQVNFTQPATNSTVTNDSTLPVTTPTQLTNTTPTVAQVDINLPLLLNYSANPALDPNNLPSEVSKLNDIVVKGKTEASLILVPFLLKPSNIQDYFLAMANQKDIIWQGLVLQSPLPLGVEAQISSTEINIDAVTDDLTATQKKSLFYIGNYINSQFFKEVNLVKLNNSEADFSRLELD